MASVGADGRRWLLDPIDGTVQFVSGGVELGHARGTGGGRPGRPRRHHPPASIDALVGGRGLGRVHRAGRVVDGSRDGRRSPCRPPTRSEAHASASTRWARPRWPRCSAPPARTCSRRRPARPSSTSAEGRLDAVIAYQCGFAWDHAPAVALAREAGGRFVDPTGGESCAARGGVYANARLLDELLAVLDAAGVRLAGEPT